MSTDEILELELSLLLIAHGERKVFRSLARVNGLNDAELETKLKRINELKKKPPLKKRSDPSKVIEDIISQHPQKAKLLEVLYSRFQSKSFLPQVRDIKRLFNKHSLESRIKSRNAAASKLFRLLASLDEKELEELAQEEDKTTYSSLGIISDEIMRRG